VDFVAGKVLDSLGVRHDLFARWTGSGDLVTED
jgi:3-polyprenyl-4-hydroxybenzoate decarboxylase